MMALSAEPSIFYANPTPGCEEDEPFVRGFVVHDAGDAQLLTVRPEAGGGPEVQVPRESVFPRHTKDELVVVRLEVTISRKHPCLC